MPRRPVAPHRSRISQYAVVWRETGERHSICAGGLTIENDRVVLRGSSGRQPVVRELPRQ
jgi:hypothetical protein